MKKLLPLKRMDTGSSAGIDYRPNARRLVDEVRAYEAGRPMMNAVFRLMLIVMLGYAAAVAAAPVMVLALQTLLSLIEGTQPPVQWSGVPDYLMLGITLTGTYAAMPFVAAIALLRLLRRRDWLTHALAGALTARCAIFLASTGALEGVEMNLVPIFIAGAGAGYVYWLVRRYFGWIAA